MCVEIHMPQDVYIYRPGTKAPINVRHVESPEGIEEIEEKAFMGYPMLRSVTIPDSVVEIGNSAFEECAELQSVRMANGLKKIGSSAFRECRSLQSVTIPDSMTEIGDNAFQGCSRLQSVTIPDSVTKIRHGVFCFCSGLQSVTLPDSVTKINDHAFYCCSSLQSVTIPDGITKIGTATFGYCTGLQSVTLPDGVTEIGDNAFYGCLGLRSVMIPDGIIKIGADCFENCSHLQMIAVPDSVTEIGPGAFRNSGLRSFVVPGKMTVIGKNTFYNCSSLRSVKIPYGITGIGNGAFEYCSELQSISIPDSVTEMDEYAFEGCSNLKSVTLSRNLTEIRFATFSGCSGLQDITIPGGITEIAPLAFADCTGLQTVTIQDGVERIDSRAFSDCLNLQSLTLPDSTVCVGSNIVDECPGLRSLIFKGTDILPFFNIDAYGADIFTVIRALINNQIPLNENRISRAIDMSHRNRLDQWIEEYRIFGEMRLTPAVKSVDEETQERLRQCFVAQKKTGNRVPEILDRLAVTVHACGIPEERMVSGFDVRYTKELLKEGIPIVPAEACRCYFDRNTCNSLISKGTISVMAEAIGLYNRSGHQECYRHLTDFILSYPDTKTEDLLYAVDHAKEIPMRAGITLTQVRQHRTYMENLAEVEKIETEYGERIPGFRLSDYHCNLEQTGITYDGMTARVLDLSDSKEIAFAARLGELTCCCQRLGRAGETAMMHGFLNPDAGFWVIQDANGTVKAQAEIWEADGGILVFDNIEFADTDSDRISERTEQFRGVIAAWAMESGYKNIIMGCGYNELGTEAMDPAPVPKLRLTPEEAFIIQEGNDAEVFFDSVSAAEAYMQTTEYDPNDFVYTDADKQCVYIKQDGTVSNYLMRGYSEQLTGRRETKSHDPTPAKSDDVSL